MTQNYSEYEQMEQQRLLYDLSTISRTYQSNLYLTQTITKLTEYVVSHKCIITNNTHIFSTFLNLLIRKDISEEIKLCLASYISKMTIF